MEAIKISEVKRDSIILVYKGQKIKINVTEELTISESVINSQLKEFPSSYSFLLMLRTNAIKERNLLDRQKDIAYSEAYLFFKDSNSNGMTNEKANHKANTSSKYISLFEKWLKACTKASTLDDICKAFESRQAIIQTLSANLRKER